MTRTRAGGDSSCRSLPSVSAETDAERMREAVGDESNWRAYQRQTDECQFDSRFHCSLSMRFRSKFCATSRALLLKA